jgi:hypothetical protein
MRSLAAEKTNGLVGNKRTIGVFTGRAVERIKSAAISKSLREICMQSKLFSGISPKKGCVALPSTTAYQE